MNELLNHLLSKIFSGRYFLTVICGIAFLYCVFNKMLEGSTITAVILSVFNSYFSRQDRGQNGDGGKNVT